jgi:DNA-binding transcriptional regulator YhcF (GntR family)
MVSASNTGSESPMDANWNDSQPIYRQLRNRVVAMILEGTLKEGDPLPSVRNVAADFRLNPLTVLKGYQQLVDEQLVEKRRGRGMYVADGAKRALMKGERQRFVEEEWPRVYATIQRLGLTFDELAAIAPSPKTEPRPSQPPPAAAPAADEDVLGEGDVSDEPGKTP